MADVFASTTLPLVITTEEAVVVAAAAAVLVVVVEATVDSTLMLAKGAEEAARVVSKAGRTERFGTFSFQDWSCVLGFGVL